LKGKINISLSVMVFLVVLGWHSAKAQEPNDHITKGNALYKDGKFGEAEVSYREGQSAGADMKRQLPLSRHYLI
jgi:hypothetical protein